MAITPKIASASMVNKRTQFRPSSFRRNGVMSIETGVGFLKLSRAAGYTQSLFFAKPINGKDQAILLCNACSVGHLAAKSGSEDDHGQDPDS